MRINSSGNVGIGTTSPAGKIHTVSDDLDNTVLFERTTTGTSGIFISSRSLITTSGDMANGFGPSHLFNIRDNAGVINNIADIGAYRDGADNTGGLTFRTVVSGSFNERMRINSSGNVGIGTTTTSGATLNIANGSQDELVFRGTGFTTVISESTSGMDFKLSQSAPMGFYTNNAERARITSDGDLHIGKTGVALGTVGVSLRVAGGDNHFTIDSNNVIALNRLTNDGNLVEFFQATTLEGTISVSGNTVSYNAFTGGHWTQLKEGRGYNPDIPRGTVMSSIGEMAVWKSVEWTETIEHPAVEAVEAKEAVLDEEGNIVEPAVEAVKGKEAWTESIPHRESYLGNLDIGETFEEDGFTKTVVDDGNERLPKVKISDVVGDKAVYGVFQTWDDVEDMLITSLGAFVVRIAAGVTVEIGDLLESNGDGCAKVQDDDIIRSKTIGKVTSTIATATYDDGSYTVPCVIYCG
jgi:hypothetical protein